MGCNNTVIPSSVASIGQYAFSFCSSLTSITILNSVTSIGQYAYEGCSNLASVTVEWNEPLTIPENTFIYISLENATLYVPAGTKTKYETADVWRKFGKIVETDESILSPIIIFADLKVKELCVANWDTNHDGELSMAEAAAVTELGEVFKNNEEITSFDELQYFTGLTSIGAGAFDNCHNLISVVIPVQVTSLESCAFIGCWSLPALVIPDGVTNIHEMALAWCGLTSITIPSSVTYMESRALTDNASLTSITVEWQEPLAVPENIFENINYSNVTLYVPEGTKAAYKAADVWKEFFMDGDDRDEYNARKLLRELIAHMEGIGGYELDDARTVSYNAEATKEEVESSITQLQQQIKDCCANTMVSELPVDATGLITNPSFSCDNAAYWQGDTPQFQIWKNAEFYETTFDIHQELTGLPNGRYLLKVKGFHRPGTNEDVHSDYQKGINNARAQLYANGESVTLNIQAAFALDEQIDGWCGAEVSSDGTTQYVPNSMQDAYMWFNNGYYENELPVTVTDGTLTLGIRLDESVGYGWVIFDDFRLEYIKPESSDSPSNTLTANDITIIPAYTSDLSVSLSNNEIIGGLQFVLTLPKGISIATDEDGEFLVKTTDRTKELYTNCEKMDNGSYRIILMSTNGATVAPGEGDIIKVKLTCDENATTGNHVISFSSIILSPRLGNVLINERNKDFTVNLTINKVSKFRGDANGDYTVNITDVLVIVDYVLNRPLKSFIFTNADFNCDGSVNITDALLIVDIILGKNTANAPEAAIISEFDLLGMDLNEIGCMVRTTAVIPAITALQMDIISPIGCKLKKASLTGKASRTHQVMTRQLKDNRYRVVVFSTKKELLDTNTSVLNLGFEGKGGLISAENIQCVDSDNLLILSPDMSAVVTDIKAGSVDAYADDPESPSYNIQGIKTKTPNRGFYIRNGKKTMVKPYTITRR